MTTATTTLASFLLDRIAEDEASANALHDYAVCDLVHHALYDPTFGWECTCDYPARVLAESAAKRRIVELHKPLGASWGEDHADCCSTCPDDPRREPGGPCPTLRALAAPYADHPDFREEWAVGSGG